MLELKFNGLRAAYRLWGSGANVALLHAGGGSSAAWTGVAELLRGSHRLIAPDLLGAGRTEPWPVKGGLTHDLQADLVAAVLRAEDSVPADIVGHSYGGATALRLAIRFPDLVRSLVLIEPVTQPLLKVVGDPLAESAARIGRIFIDSLEAGHPEQGWELFIDSRNKPGTWSALSESRKAKFLESSQRVAEAFLSNWSNPTTLEECRSLRIAPTIVTTEHAIPEDRRITEILREAIPHARPVTLAGVGHMAPLTHPEMVARMIQDHLMATPVAIAGR